MWEQAWQTARLSPAPAPSSPGAPDTHLEGLPHTVQLGQKVLVTVAAQELSPEEKHSQSPPPGPAQRCPLGSGWSPEWPYRSRAVRPWASACPPLGLSAPQAEGKRLTGC